MQPSTLSRLRFTFAFFKLHNVLHPPLPLTPREHNRLLDLIKDSFRQQLDAVPPPPTDSHVGNLLVTLPFSTSLDGNKGLERINDDPIGVFEQQVLAGRATLGLAGLCLNKYNEGIKTNRRRAGERSAVVRVLEGLQKSGLASHLDAIRNSLLAQPIVETLVVEGREKAILDWLGGSSLSGGEKLRLLRCGVAVTIERNGIEKAVEIFERSLRVSAERYHYRDFQPVGVHLCQKVKESGNATLLERLVSGADRWSRSRFMEAAIHLRFLRRTDAAIDYFLELDQADGESCWNNSSLRSDAWYNKTARMGLELGMVCVEKEQWEDAAAITDILRRRFCGKATGLPAGCLEAQDRGMAEVVLRRALDALKSETEVLPKKHLNDILNRWAAA